MEGEEGTERETEGREIGTTENDDGEEGEGVLLDFEGKEGEGEVRWCLGEG